jgi:hypothetical protein
MDAPGFDSGDRGDFTIGGAKARVPAISRKEHRVTGRNFNRPDLHNIKTFRLLSGDCPFAALTTDDQALFFHADNFNAFVLGNPIHCAMKAQDLAREEVFEIIFLGCGPTQRHMTL